MSRSELITPQHLTRKAMIYIRQSSPQQMLSNQESLRLQYALRQRAEELGWQPEYVELIDTDLGLTAAAAAHRAGFKELLAQVTLGHVGIILSIDVTRLSRNCSDWYPLLDLCGFKGCLIADRDGVYDPATANGRLLLGLKGQISELELHTIRARLTAGLLNKARRGELALQLPIGLMRDERGVVSKTPNMEVQERIELVFARFLQVKSASKVAKSLNEQQLSIPRRDRFGDTIWKRPTSNAVILMLRNPAYAGAFVYGRRESVRKDLSVRRPLQRALPINQWKMRVNDKYPAYVSWQLYEKIQQMLDDNRAEYSRNRTRGIPRDGAALLQGIVYCGESGHKMTVQYKQGTHYRCVEMRKRYGVPVCQHIPADQVDQQVMAAFFAALAPAELDIYEQAMRQQTAADEKVRRALRQQLERCRYEVALAERQYRRVDPDNRLVAGELERRWEEALRELRRAEENMDGHCHALPPTSFQFDPQFRAALTDIGKRLPEVWHAGHLSRAQKKALLRCLIEKVVVRRAVRDRVETRIVWRGGETTTFEVPIAVGSFTALTSAAEMEAEIVALSRANCTDKEIAERLNAQGHRSPRRERVIESTVRNVRLKHKIFVDRSQSISRRPAGYLAVSELAKQLGINQHWLYYRIHKGSIEVKRDVATGLYLFADTEETMEQLRQLKSGMVKTIRL